MVSGRTILRESVRVMTRNKLRSGLSALGISAGTAAVICVVAIGQGSAAQVAKQWHNLGDNQIWIEAGAPRLAGVYQGIHTTKTLTVADALAIQTQVPLISMVSPNADSNVQTIYGNQNWGTSIHGVGPSYFAIKNFDFDEGSTFTQENVEHQDNVVVLGYTVKQALFGPADGLGRVIRIKSLPFTVIGTLLPKGQSATGQDQDDLVLVPYTTAMRKIVGQSWLDDIYTSAASTDSIPQAEMQVTELLHERHRINGIQQDDFKIRHPEDLIEAESASSHTLSLLLLAAGAISLLVGGVGVMNVMLAAVVERTREIGIRLAVGATEADVKAQFLAEAVLLSLAGAAAGTCLSVAGSLALSSWLEWPLPVSLWAVLVGVIVACATGVCFGYYPARTAAQLDPIEALRYE